MGCRRDRNCLTELGILSTITVAGVGTPVYIYTEQKTMPLTSTQCVASGIKGVRVPTTSLLSSVLMLCMRTSACRELSMHLATSASVYRTIPCRHEIITIIIIIFSDILATVALGPVPVSNPSHWRRTQFDSRSIHIFHLPQVGFLLVFFSLSCHCNMDSFNKGGH